MPHVFLNLELRWIVSFYNKNDKYLSHFFRIFNSTTTNHRNDILTLIYINMFRFLNKTCIHKCWIPCIRMSYFNKANTIHILSNIMNCIMFIALILFSLRFNCNINNFIGYIITTTFNNIKVAALCI